MLQNWQASSSSPKIYLRLPIQILSTQLVLKQAPHVRSSICWSFPNKITYIFYNLSDLTSASNYYSSTSKKGILNRTIPIGGLAFYKTSNEAHRISFIWEGKAADTHAHEIRYHCKISQAGAEGKMSRWCPNWRRHQVLSVLQTKISETLK